jgi:hypothetical protein
VIGWHPAVEFVADRGQPVQLFETDFVRDPAIPGTKRKKAPAMPRGVTLASSPAGPYGAVVIFRSVSGVFPDPVTGARIMGPLDAIKVHLRGRKFFIQNRYRDWVCVELA